MTGGHHTRHEAMATQWDLVLAEPGLTDADAASISRLVFEEVDRLEGELSRFRPASDIWRVNGLLAGESTPVDLAAWDCLSLAKAVHAETGGAFDITIGPLMKCFRASDGSSRVPFPGEWEAACEKVGMDKFTLEEGLYVRSDLTHLGLDLGAIGKGYALDQCWRVLEEQGISHAFLSAGESTLLALGHPPDEPRGWEVAVHLEGAPELHLCNEALSCSGFAVQGAHIIDARTRMPLSVQPRRSYVRAPTAALSDALSTACLILRDAEIADLQARFPQVQVWTGLALE